ncbi:hypothetical protein AALA83_15420 [Oscillospiraceae bacterium 44-5]
MLSLTEDQQYFMDILETAGFVRTDQVLPLLRINEPWKELNHAEAMLRRLRYRDFRKGDPVILAVVKYGYERSMIYGHILSKW